MRTSRILSSLASESRTPWSDCDEGPGAGAAAARLTRSGRGSSDSLIVLDIRAS